MFTRFLSFSLLLLGLSAFGQAFTPLRPFIGASSSGGVSPPGGVPGLAYWWVASDLTNSPVDTWTDRIQGASFTATTNKPTWNVNYVEFYGTNWMWMPSPVYVKCKGDTNDAYINLIFSQNDVTAGGVMVGSTNSTVQQYMGMQSPNLRWGTADIGDIPENTIIDYLYGGWKGSIPQGQYTNGVQAAQQLTTSLDSHIAAIGNKWKTTAASGFTFVGKIYEIAVWTNVPGRDTLSLAEVAAIHKYSTNTYGFSP